MRWGEAAGGPRCSDMAAERGAYAGSSDGEWTQCCAVDCVKQTDSQFDLSVTKKKKKADFDVEV